MDVRSFAAFASSCERAAQETTLERVTQNGVREREKEDALDRARRSLAAHMERQAALECQHFALLCQCRRWDVVTIDGGRVLQQLIRILGLKEALQLSVSKAWVHTCAHLIYEGAPTIAIYGHGGRHHRLMGCACASVESQWPRVDARS